MTFAASDPNWTDIVGAVAAVVGVVGVLIALFFTAWQIYRQRLDQHEALQEQTAQRALGLVQFLNDITRIMVRRPYLVPYIHDNKPLPEEGDPVHSAVLAYARLFMNLGEAVGWQIRAGPMKKDGALSWRLYFTDLHESSHAVRSVLKRHEEIARERHEEILAGETLWLFGIGEPTDATLRLDIPD